MDIIQVLIFIVIMLMAIRTTNTQRRQEERTPSPKEVLADMFPEIEQESMEEKVSVSPAPAVRKPQSSRMQNQSIIRKAVASPLAENKRENRTPIKLSTKEEARRAFIYSEIFNRKY